MPRNHPVEDRVVAHVELYPGCTPRAVAIAIGPHGSTRYGYNAVHRALAKLRITALPHPGNKAWSILVPSNYTGQQREDIIAQVKRAYDHSSTPKWNRPKWDNGNGWAPTTDGIAE